MTVYRTFHNKIYASLDQKIPLIGMVRLVYDDLSLKEAKELVENVGEAIGMSYDAMESIKLFEYMLILNYAYRLNIKDNSQWALERITLRWIDDKRLRVYQMLFCEWINARRSDE